MRLLCVTTSYPIGDSSVSGIFVKKLVNALECVGHDICVVVPNDPRFKANEVDCKQKIVSVRYAPQKYERVAHLPGGLAEALKRSRMNWILLVSLILAMIISIRKKISDTDVVVANWSLSGVCALLASIGTSVPVVCILRGSDVNVAAKGLIGKALIDLVIKKCDAVVCVSSALRKELEVVFHNSASNVQVIENGVDIYGADTLDKESLSPRKKIIFVGNVTKNKGVDIILRAVGALQRKGLSCCVDFIGGGDLDTYRHLATTIGVENVNFTDSVPHEIALKLIRSADVMVNASYSEGRSNALLEALSMGVPVLASDIPVNVQLLEGGKYGALFRCGSVESMIQALDLLFNYYENSLEKSRLAKIFFLKRTWMHCAEEYDSLFRKLHIEKGSA